MSERFSGGFATEGEVEKLHVPASIYWSGAAPNRVTHNDVSTTAAPLGQTLDQAEMEAAELAAAAEMDMDMDAEL